MSTIILAMDVGKSRTAACVYDTGTDEHRTRTIATRPGEVRELVEEVKPARVAMEIGPAAGWIHDLCRELGVEVQVANTNHEAWRWKNVKRKSDRTDAIKLAKLSATRQLPLVHMPEARVRQWRELIAYRKQLVKRRTMIKNSIRSTLERHAVEHKASKTGWTLEAQAALRESARALADCGPTELWRGALYIELDQLSAVQEAIHTVEVRLDAISKTDQRVAVVAKERGVGPRLAETIVAAIDDPLRFKRGKQVASYAGLTPRQYQSGSMDRQGKISGEGNAILRSILVEVAWVGLRINPWMQEVYAKALKGSPSRKKIAIVAVARRLLVRLWAKWRDWERERRAAASDALPVPAVGL